MRRQNPEGFTLIEVIVVLGLLGILGALAYPQYRSWAQNAQYREVAREVASTLREARSLAVGTRLEHRVEITNGSYHLERWAPTSEDEEDDKDWDKVTSVQLPSHVRLHFSGSSPLAVSFLPNGSASSQIQVEIRDASTPPSTRFTVEVTSAATGRVVIR